MYIYIYSIYVIPEFKPWFPHEKKPADQRWRPPTPAKESVFEDGAFHFDVISLEAATRKAGTPDSLGASSFFKGNTRCKTRVSESWNYNISWISYRMLIVRYIYIYTYIYIHIYIYIYYIYIYILLDNRSDFFVSLAGQGRFLHFGHHSYIAGSCRETAKQPGFFREV